MAEHSLGRRVGLGFVFVWFAVGERTVMSDYRHRNGSRRNVRIVDGFSARKELHRAPRQRPCCKPRQSNPPHTAGNSCTRGITRAVSWRASDPGMLWVYGPTKSVCHPLWDVFLDVPEFA
jgi:hypothetical protein